ncbi:MAG: hypothetical protein LBD93_05875 [Treponema sp.]|jgi:hypothetical protein|nr:hypothetical protein [Treponema sp.]
MKHRIHILLLLWIPAAVYGQSTGFPDFSFGMPDVEKAMVLSDMALMKLDKRIPMRFGNALDGKPIAGGQVEIPGVGSFVTDSRGIISFPEQADGNYTLVFTKKGFIPTAIPFKIQLSTVIFNWYSISPELQGDFRFVLDWGERPADLDLHFEKEGGYHISYRNMRTAADGSGKLDRDDTSGYGPETITVARAEAGGVYHLYVIDYTNRNNSASPALSRSGATIRVYSQNRLLETFTVPDAGNGYRWNVCDISQNRIVQVNRIGP